jgi:fructokinase
MLVGGIEGGGTKFVCAVSDENGHLLNRILIPTTDPQTVLGQAITFFKKEEALRTQRLAALGIGTFGPLDLDTTSGTYGFITQTPKPGWKFANLIGPLQAAFPDLPIGFDTDVNAAALGEYRWGAAQGRDTFVYLTVGTGIGGGGMVGGRIMHGLIHPEMGHVVLPVRPDDPLERGVCPFHGNCLEGLAAGPSLKARWGVPGEQLPPDHPAWDLEAHYLALAAVDFLCTFSPQVIILGGSVMHQQQLYPLVRRKVRDLLNGYLVHPRLETLDDVIVPPALKDDAGVLGAVALALAALDAA